MTFYSQISANKRNSFLIGLALVGILGALGMTIGYALTGSVSGALSATVGAIVLGVLASAVSYYKGYAIVLAASGAREIGERARHSLEANGSGDHRCEHPPAQGLCHRRHLDERLRDRARPGPFVDRDH